MRVPDDVTQILKNWSDGDSDAPEKLMPLVYEELRRRARSYLARERGDHTLQAIALVHEACLRLANQTRLTWKDRTHFYGITARMMRVAFFRELHEVSRQGAEMNIVT